MACLASPTDFGRPTVSARAAVDLARILLKCTEFDWPPPYETLDAVLRTTDVGAEGLQLMRHAALGGHRHAAKALSEAHQSGRWGVKRVRKLAAGWLACANEADAEGRACEAMASSLSQLPVGAQEPKQPVTSGGQRDEL